MALQTRLVRLAAEHCGRIGMRLTTVFLHVRNLRGLSVFARWVHQAGARLQNVSLHLKNSQRPALLIRGIFGLMLMIGLWMAFAEVDSVVRARGRVIPAGRTQVIQHLEGGIVTAIAVREGAMVKTGDLLVTLSDTRADSQLLERRVKLAGLRTREARLLAESEGRDKIDFPDDIAWEIREREAERDLFAVRRQKMFYEIEGLSDQLRQRQISLNELESRRKSLASELDVAQQQLGIITVLIEKNAASQLELLEARSRLQRLQTQIGDVVSAIPKTRSSIQEAQNKVHEITSRHRSDASTELIAARLEINQMNQEIRAESDRVDRTEVRAKIAGVINRLYTNTVGGVVKPGEPIIELTPVDDKRILLEGSVRPSDRAELRNGLTANVRIAAYDFGVFGVLHGVLLEVSADTVADEHGDRYYRVLIEVPSLPSAYHDKVIAPGMTASADVVTGSRTILQYVLSPLTRFAYNAFREPR